MSDEKLLKEVERIQQVARHLEKQRNRKAEEKKTKKKLIAVTEASTLPSRKIRGKAIEEIPKVMVPLTEDLSGSLRTMKALPASKVFYILSFIVVICYHSNIHYNIYYLIIFFLIDDVSSFRKYASTE